MKIETSVNLIDINRASELLALPHSRIRFEVFRKNIPYYKIGRSIRFSEKDLITWVLDQKQEVRYEAPK